MMNWNLKILFLLFLLPWGVINCSLDVKKAVAPTNPPQVEKNIFSASQVRGHYQTDGSPKMFKWPVDKWNEDKTQLLPMTFAEKVQARQTITAYSEEVELYTQEFTALEKEINLKYENKLKELENRFLTNQCYSFCDPDSLFCDPEDSSVLIVDDWKLPENEEETLAIASCQENQSQRENISEDFEYEINEKVEPLRIKAGQAALALLQTVGDRNYFTELTSFEFFFGPYECSSNKGCLLSNEVESDKIYIRLQFGDLVLTNFDGDSGDLRVYDVGFDPAQGFLVFKTPAIDFENSQSIYGEITYDLELLPGLGVLRADGDIRVKENEVDKEFIGRFSSAGILD